MRTSDFEECSFDVRTSEQVSRGQTVNAKKTLERLLKQETRKQRLADGELQALAVAEKQIRKTLHHSRLKTTKSELRRQNLLIKLTKTEGEIALARKTAAEALTDLHQVQAKVDIRHRAIALSSLETMLPTELKRATSLGNSQVLQGGDHANQ